MMEVIAGIDIGGSHIGFGILLKDDHSLIYEHHVDHDNTLDQDGLLSLVVNTVQEILSNHVSWTLVSAGIGCPGHCKNGIVMKAANLPFNHYPLASKLSQAFDNIPTFLINDADAAIAAEVWSNDTCCHYTGYDNVAMITIGTGVGMGLILNNRLFRGSNGLIEGGHMIISSSSSSSTSSPEKCSCGQYGCVEQISSAKFTTKRYNDMMTMTSSSHVNGTKEIFQLAANGDEVATAVLEQTAEGLALMCINISRTVDPDIIILAGGMSQAGDVLIAMVKKHVDRLAWTCLPTYFKLATAHAVGHAGIIGAALAAAQAYRK